MPGRKLTAKIVNDGRFTYVYLNGDEEFSSRYDNFHIKFHENMHNKLRELINLGYKIYY